MVHSFRVSIAFVRAIALREFGSSCLIRPLRENQMSGGGFRTFASRVGTPASFGLLPIALAGAPDSSRPKRTAAVGPLSLFERLGTEIVFRATLQFEEPVSMAGFGSWLKSVGSRASISFHGRPDLQNTAEYGTA